ncbi:MAG: T9SS type A sorting domain-containing protein [Bacteroidia bacterium]
MTKKPLPIVLLIFLYLFPYQSISAQDVLFKVHFAGKTNHPQSLALKSNLIALGLENGFEIVDWDQACLSNPATYPEIIFAVEEGDLWTLDESKRETLTESLIGGQGRRGGALIVVRLGDNNEQQDQSKSVRKWDWLETLIYPENLKSVSTNTEVSVPNQAILNVSGKSGEKWISGNEGAFARQLPHPTPQSAYEGGKVYYSHLSDNNLSKSAQQEIPLALQDIWLKAIMWTADYDDGSNLSVPYLSLFAENQDQYVRLDWLTNSEINNDFFEVQRSTDGENWIPQNRLSAIGDQQGNSFYDFTDYDLVPGRYYYRLLQQSRDGSQNYSGLVAVDVEMPDPLVFVFPNPVSEMLAIETSTSQETILDYRIESISGVTVWQQNSETKQAFHRIEVGVNQLPAGIYQLRVRSENGERVQQFIKY